MYYCCPKCGAIAEYNAYYGRITCTSCKWESEKKVLIKSKIVDESAKGVNRMEPIRDEELEREVCDEENPTDAIWILDGRGRLVLQEVADDDADD